jgi:hypothetical protein
MPLGSLQGMTPPYSHTSAPFTLSFLFALPADHVESLTYPLPVPALYTSSDPNSLACCPSHVLSLSLPHFAYFPS